MLKHTFVCNLYRFSVILTVSFDYDFTSYPYRYALQYERFRFQLDVRNTGTILWLRYSTVALCPKFYTTSVNLWFKIFFNCEVFYFNQEIFPENLQQFLSIFLVSESSSCPLKVTVAIKTGRDEIPFDDVCKQDRYRLNLLVLNKERNRV